MLFRERTSRPDELEPGVCGHISWIGLMSGSDVIWGLECLVWHPGEMEFRGVEALYRVSSSLQRRKADSHGLQAMIHARWTQLLRRFLKLCIAGMSGRHVISSQCLTGVGDVFSCQRFVPMQGVSDLRMGFFQPSTSDDQIAARFPQGCLNWMGCLLVEGTHPGQPGWIDGGTVLPQGGWVG